MFKMGLPNPFDYLKHKLWPKERLGVKVPIDFQPVKVENGLELHACMWHATYRWKAFNDGYNFALNLASIRCFQKNVWPSKMIGAAILRILGLSTWEFGDKMTFTCSPCD